MSKKNERNTKGKIINAAWDLFYEYGYEDTTVEEITQPIPEDTTPTQKEEPETTTQYVPVGPTKPDLGMGEF